mgnify:CR=1 FL=1
MSAIAIRLLHKGVVVGETSLPDNNVHSSVGYNGLIETCMRVFGIDFSQYRLSDMVQIPGRLDFLLKEEDYIKLRNDKINKILS